MKERSEINRIHRFEFLNINEAMCIFALGSKFTYKGSPNDYLPTVNSILRRINNVWKIDWMQRSPEIKNCPCGISRFKRRFICSNNLGRSFF